MTAPVDTSAEAVRGGAALLRATMTQLMIAERLRMADLIESLAAERDELQDVFNRSWDADKRAIKAWQQTNPGNDLVWPGRTALTAWLLAERDALRAALTVIASQKTSGEFSRNDRRYADFESGHEDVVQIARAALKGNTP